MVSKTKTLVVLVSDEGLPLCLHVEEGMERMNLFPGALL